MAVALLLLMVGNLFAIELPDRCDIRYQKCVYDCIQEFPLDKEKRKGCELRCELGKGWCKTKSGAKKLTEGLRRMWEGFSRER